MSAIDDKYLLLGGARSFLGQPEIPARTTQNGLHSDRSYEDCSIQWNHAVSKEAC